MPDKTHQLVLGHSVRSDVEETLGDVVGFLGVTERNQEMISSNGYEPPTYGPPKETDTVSFYWLIDILGKIVAKLPGYNAWYNQHH